MSAQTAPTQHIRAENGITYAYRRFGKASSIPVAFHNCFRANMDWWDPLLINTIAETREVILFDNQGVGRTPGEVPASYQNWAEEMIGFLEALGVGKVDLFGFSMGARTVQFVALKKPALARKLVLAGSSPLHPSPKFKDIRDGRYMMAMANADSPQEGIDSFRFGLFSDDAKGQAAWDAYWSRMKERNVELPMLELLPRANGGLNQVKAIVEADAESKKMQSDPLLELKMPVFVANGTNDLVLGTPRSVDLFERLENAQLTLYPKSGHGFLDQYPEQFGRDVNTFLDFSEMQ